MEVWIGERRLESLAPRPFKLLNFLYMNMGRVCSEGEIGNYIWGELADEGKSVAQYDLNMLHQLISRLRRAIEPDPRRPVYILNVPGIGYRLYDRPRASA
jgi:DNA-binding response OmpR family regulator